MEAVQDGARHWRDRMADETGTCSEEPRLLFVAEEYQQMERSGTVDPAPVREIFWGRFEDDVVDMVMVICSVVVVELLCT